MAGPSDAQQLLELIHGNWIAQAVTVAAELEIADLLAQGPRTSIEISQLVKTDASAMHRLLRALTTIDICRERGDDTFELAPMGALLRRDHPESLRHWCIWWGHYLWPVWGNLKYSVTTGKSARSLLTGTEGFDHLQKDPEAAAVFNLAMAELTAMTCQSVVPAYDFSGSTRIVDVGGGYGQLLAAILAKYPAARGVLFDLPHAIEEAKQRLAQSANLKDRVEFVAGDFFESVPSGGDAYVLKSIIHDWNDERSHRILENCRRAMSAGARLLLIERIVPERLDTSEEHRSLARTDLSMLVALGAQERSESEFRSLLASAGFQMTRIIPAGMTVSIIEAKPCNEA